MGKRLPFSGSGAEILVLNPVPPELPIILCTGYSSHINREKVIKCGIRGFANKPLVRKELAETVRRMLDGRGAIDKENS